MWRASLRLKAIRTASQAALPSIKQTAMNCCKLLAGSVLAVVAITLSCGQFGLSTNPVCTSITTAIRGLLLPIEMPTPAPSNNIKTDTLFPKNDLLHLPMYPSFSALSEKQIRIIKSVISTAVNMGILNSEHDPTITSASSIIPSMTSNYSRTTKDSTPTPHPAWTNIGLTGSPPLLNSTTGLLLIQPDIYFPKLPAKEPKITICAATNTARRTGSYLNIPACPPATKIRLAD